MILPIVAFGDAVLRKKAENITNDYKALPQLINDMFETMYNANGVGLAAPQIGLAIRLFVIDTSPFAEDEKELENFKRVFINAQILDEAGEAWKFNEGCLSIPGVREDVLRKPDITITYLDENFDSKTEKFSGLAARIIQHEYDHIEGILFTDKLNPLRKRMIKGKLNDISNGKVNVDYRMRFIRK